MPRIRTASMEAKRWVIVIGGFLLAGTEGAMCRSDPLLREVCCLPVAQIKDMKRKLPTQVQPPSYYPLLISQVDSNEVDQ